MTPLRGARLRMVPLLALVAMAVGLWLLLSLIAPRRLQVLAAPGDRSQGARLVHQFLHGEEPGCSQKPPILDCAKQPFLHAPDSWSKRAVHDTCPAEDCTPFYHDAASQSGIKDTDPNQGLENGHLIFYAGHGTEFSWSVPEESDGDEVTIDDISLGDVKARYIWMVSCRVMAHGPKIDDTDYLAPHLFVPGQRQEDVFRSWAETRNAGGAPRIPLNSNLRLACGGSSRIGGGSSFPMSSVWHYKLLTGLPVADSFVLGLAKGFRVPLCMARGGARPEQSPIFDQEFSTVANTHKRPGRLYIQYPIHLQPPPTIVQTISEKFSFSMEELPAPVDDTAVQKLPVLKLAPTPLPAKLAGPQVTQPQWFQELQRLPFGFYGTSLDQLLRLSGVNMTQQLLPSFNGVRPDTRDVCVKLQPQSGAVVASWRPRREITESTDTEAVFTAETLSGLIDGFGLTALEWTAGRSQELTVKSAFPEIRILRMRVDGVPESDAAQGELQEIQIKRYTKCFYVALQGAVAVNGVRVPIFGEGGEWLFAFCPYRSASTSVASRNNEDSSVCLRPVPPILTVSWSGRAVRSQSPAPVIDLDTARNLAKAKLARLEPLEAYQEPSYRLGYKAAPIHCSQRDMYLVYEFDFRPKIDDRYEEFPEITIEVPGHVLGNKRIEDSWECSPEKPG